MKKKVAILTINDYTNYGNRLQNYAVQEVLKSYDFDVITLVHNLDKSTLIAKENYYQKSIYKTIKNYLKSHGKIRRIYRKMLSKRRSKSPLFVNARIETFKKFTNEFIKETDFVISDSDFPNDLNNRFDYFVTGSDQVWNPHFRFCSEIDFLTFAQSNKRIAFSASIGVNEIPSELKDKYKSFIAGFKAISVREIQAQKIVDGLTGRDATVLIDPTLNLSKNQWLKVSKVHINKPINPYLLIYFLGDIPMKYKSFIEDYAKLHSLEVVNLADKGSEKYYTADPSNFIDYINDAHTFFTDSYHGIIFSILLETQFLIFERISGSPKMNSRLETLKMTLKLPREAFYKEGILQPYIHDKNIYEPIINKEKAKVQEFINKYMV